jgi:hypothetical protein
VAPASETVPDRAALLRLAAGVALALILIGGFEPFYLRIFAMDRTRMGASFAELPYRKMTGLRAFLIGVDAHTPPHTRIAIWVPFRQWEGGYGYAYYRASYLLPGKQVVPLLKPNEDRPQVENLAQADYIACWGGRIEAPGFVPAWQDGHGVLLRRER